MSHASEDRFTTCEPSNQIDNSISHEIQVPLSVDGRRYFAGLTLNNNEHQRRQEAGLGAVTSTGLLHALWEIPYGMAFPLSCFRSIDQKTLCEADNGWIQNDGDELSRLYQPVGTIKSIAASDTSLVRAVSKAASHPQTVRRTAVWFTSTDGRSPKAIETLTRAKLLGVGVIAVNKTSIVHLAESSDPIASRPSVFRWWQAELAYRNWINSKQPTESIVAWA